MFPTANQANPRSVKTRHYKSKYPNRHRPKPVFSNKYTLHPDANS